MSDPTPPYAGPIPPRYRETPFKDLPIGLQKRVMRNLPTVTAAPKVKAKVQAKILPAEAAEPKKRPGRPKGSKNKPKDSITPTTATSSTPHRTHMVATPAAVEPSSTQPSLNPDWAVSDDEDND